MRETEKEKERREREGGGKVRGIEREGLREGESERNREWGCKRDREETDTFRKKENYNRPN